MNNRNPVLQTLQIKEKLLLESDIFVLPSYFEGLPIGVIEAMANKVAVVATNVGGIPDILEAGVEGLLVAPYDVEQLSQALSRLLEDNDFKQLLETNAFKRASVEFNVDIVNERLLSIYAQCL